MDCAPKPEEDTLEGCMDKGLKYLMLSMSHLSHMVIAKTEVETARERVYTLERVFSHMQALYSAALYEIDRLQKQVEEKRLDQSTVASETQGARLEVLECDRLEAVFERDRLKQELDRTRRNVEVSHKVAAKARSELRSLAEEKASNEAERAAQKQQLESDVEFYARDIHQGN